MVGLTFQQSAKYSKKYELKCMLKSIKSVIRPQQFGDFQRSTIPAGIR